MEEIAYVDSICIWVGSVRRTDFHTGEMWYQSRFQCSYGDPYHYCTYFFMDHGISGRGTTRHRKCFCQNLDISDPVGLLLPVLPGCATSVHCRSEMWIRWSGRYVKCHPLHSSRFLFLHESISPLKLLCVVLIGAGTYLMITKRNLLLRIPGKKAGNLVLLRAWLCRLCQPDFYSGKSRH